MLIEVEVEGGGRPSRRHLARVSKGSHEGAARGERVLARLPVEETPLHPHPPSRFAAMSELEQLKELGRSFFRLSRFGAGGRLTCPPGPPFAARPQCPS